VNKDIELHADCLLMTFQLGGNMVFQEIR